VCWIHTPGERVSERERESARRRGCVAYIHPVSECVFVCVCVCVCERERERERARRRWCVAYTHPVWERERVSE